MANLTENQPTIRQTRLTEYVLICPQIKEETRKITSIRFTAQLQFEGRTRTAHICKSKWVLSYCQFCSALGETSNHGTLANHFWSRKEQNGVNHVLESTQKQQKQSTAGRLPENSQDRRLWPSMN